MFFGGDPFEHFAHGGGGSRRSGMGRPSADVDTTKLYETLGVRIYIIVEAFAALHCKINV